MQAGVQLMNFRSSWLTVRNVLEYYFWFRSRLHVHARQGFIPLGGNTVFVRTKILRAVSGWDPECLAEDCELGRAAELARSPTVVVYEPELVTREECPATLRHLPASGRAGARDTYRRCPRGYWRRLPRTAAHPRRLHPGDAVPDGGRLADDPVALATACDKAPVPSRSPLFLPALPILAILAVEVAGLGQFCRKYGERASARDYARLVFGLPLYQAVLAFASARAVVARSPRRPRLGEDRAPRAPPRSDRRLGGPGREDQRRGAAPGVRAPRHGSFAAALAVAHPRLDAATERSMEERSHGPRRKRRRRQRL